MLSSMTTNEIAQVSGRGTVTLPARIRKELGLREGDVLRVRLVDGSIQLTPTAVVPIELYTEERIAEFLAAAEMTPEELARAREAWGLPADHR
jgi:antitoxin PrlF